MSKIIITGATSFLGINLIRQLIANDVLIYAVVRPNSSKIGLLPESPKIIVIPAEMENYKDIGISIQESCDCLVHFAWKGTRGSDRMNQAMQISNYECSIDILKAALRLNCKTFISAGSQAEYGLYNQAISEEIPCVPNTEYGIQKLRFYQDASKICKEHGVNFKEPRFFSIYGPGDFEGTMVISTLKKMLRNDDCEFTECKQMWDFLYISDAVKGIIRLIYTDCADGAYNIGRGESRPLKSYIEEMYKLTHSKSRLFYGSIPYPSTGMVSVQPIFDKLVNETGWHAEVTFVDGIQRIINYLNYGGQV